MTEHNRSFDEDSKVRMGNYWSRTQDVDEPEPAKFKMYCPHCKKMVFQDKSFIEEKAQGQEPCVRCHQCGLIHDSRHYKQMIAKQRAKGDISSEFAQFFQFRWYEITTRSKSKKRKSVPRVYHKSTEEIKNEIRKYGYSDSTIIELSSAANKKRDACN